MKVSAIVFLHLRLCQCLLHRWIVPSRGVSGLRRVGGDTAGAVWAVGLAIGAAQGSSYRLLHGGVATHKEEGR